jgi:succinate dehydrogenase / fumarate reductase iron-sulfur subunit
MDITLAVERYNPETDAKPYMQEYSVSAEPTDRVLDALISVWRNHDGTLTFRKSCAHGVCGSDAMRINGTERLACKTLIKDVVTESETTIEIKPLAHLTVQRDLMVDQTPFFDNFRRVKPFMHPAEEPPEAAEFFQSQKDRDTFDDATKCINCQACFSACPVLDKNPQFIGPAAIVNAARFVFDSRDKGLEPRLAALDEPNGVWPCENHFQCTRVCPRGIKVTKLINLTKREINKYREARGEQTAEPKE